MLHVLLSVIWAALPAASFHAAPLQQFQSQPLEGNVRRFWHSVERAFEDGSTAKLDWTLHADPEKILSFDEERNKADGIRLVACSGDRMTLKVPIGRLSEVKRWESIVASSAAHICEDVAGYELYAKILNIESTGANVVLRIQEVNSHADLVPYMSFEYEYKPPDPDKDMGQISDEGRRLGWGNASWDVNVHTGDPTDTNAFGSSSQSGPSELKKFGWNWDWESQQVKKSVFNYSLPGADGYLSLFDPYLKANASLKIWYQSIFEDIQKPPHVRMTVALDGQATIHGRMVTLFDSNKDAIDNPLATFEVPILTELSQPKYLGDISLNVGNIPISFNPGVQLQARAYHVGKFKGTLQVGIDTLAEISPQLIFDSEVGVDTNFQARLLNVKLWPPTWLVFTDHFETGVVLEANLWIKGRVGGLKDAQVGLGVKPYMNLTITRPSTGVVGAVPNSNVKPLMVYPFRANGLPKGKSYAIKVGANGVYHQTTSQMSFDGIVEYNDHASDFQFGALDREMLMKGLISVSLLEDGKEPAVGNINVLCGVLMDGICTPGVASSPETARRMQAQASSWVRGGSSTSPVQAVLQVKDENNMEHIVTIDMQVVWQDYPKPVLVDNIYGLGFGFPTITLTEDLSTQLAGGGGFFSGGEQPFYARILRGGHSYDAPMELNRSDPKAFRLSCKTNHMADLGTTYRPSWANWPGEIPSIHLVHGEEIIASKQLPNWLSPLEGGDTQLVPIDVFNPKDFSQIVGSGELTISVQQPSKASFFIYPYQYTQLQLGEVKGLYWASQGAEPGTPIRFVMHAMKITDFEAVTPKYEVIEQSKKTVDEVCSAIAMPGGYDSYTNDCIFTADFVFQKEQGLQVGDQVVIRLSWEADGWTHEMLSPPVLMVEAGPIALYQMVTPKENEVLNKGAPTRNLDVSWSSFDSDHEKDDRKHCQLHGLGKDSTCGLSNKLNNPSRRMALRITKKDTATEVYHREDIDPKAMFHRVPGSVVQQWQDGDYEVKLSWDNAAALRRSLRISSISSSAGYSRRLQDVASMAWTSQDTDWKQKMYEFNPNCAEEPLSYGLGSGVLVRGTVKNIKVPENFPVIGGLMSAPNFNSGYQPVVAPIGLNNSLEAALPDFVCSGGLCEGELPGCPPPHFAVAKIPMISFQLSRPFHWTPQTPMQVRSYIAYAFSILPAAIKAHIIRLNVSLPNSVHEDRNFDTPPNVFTPPGVQPSLNSAGDVQMPMGVVNQPAPAVIPAPIPAPIPGSVAAPIPAPTTLLNGPTVAAPAPMPAPTNALNGANPMVVPTPTPAPTPAQIAGSLAAPIPAPAAARRLTQGDTFTSFAVTFNEALPYTVDQQLLQTLLHNGAFDLLRDGREKELGEVKIIGFNLEGDSVPHLSAGKIADDLDFVGFRLPAAALACFVTLLGLMVYQIKRRPPLEDCRPGARRQHHRLARNDPSEENEGPQFVDRGLEEGYEQIRAVEE